MKLFKRRTPLEIKMFLLFLFVFFLFLAVIAWGGGQFISFTGRSDLVYLVLYEIRLPKSITALSSGALLALCGLILQTYFQNPLAGPFVLGIHGGASLGVASWVYYFAPAMALGSQGGLVTSSIAHRFGVTSFSLFGSFMMMLLLIGISTKVKEKSSLMIFGLLMGFFTSGVLSLMAAIHSADQLKSFYMWTLGNFARTSLFESYLLAILLVFVTAWLVLLSKKMNLFLLGEDYAQSLGVKVRSLKIQLIVLSSVIIGVVISFCGPIAFIGLMGPHLARYYFKSADHKHLIYGCLLMGGMLALIAEMFAGGGLHVSLPLNATLSLLGIPLFLFLFLFTRKISRSRHEAQG